MEKINCQPDVNTCNSLINCYGKNGDANEAHMRFKEMQETGLNSDVMTYSTLIECISKTSKVSFLNIVTYNILLDCLPKCAKTTEVLEFYVKLKQQRLTPDSITYVVLEQSESRNLKHNPIIGWE
ncbi:hypothetical protein AQUCO_00300224v1 [Aquilegia coerulea]|uniref:Pentacotripeptide-repeat region of PRORP domain-containing protein n=1 Tax=Aquilegia coerulea TaxID=218851 RepID=A0A2G5EXZ8_AQUCA|nr:hypothetical protein AQUCO_00300224v1 [Aquilegia coerulea]